MTDLIREVVKLAEDHGELVVGFALGFVVGAGWLMMMLRAILNALPDKSPPAGAREPCFPSSGGRRPRVLMKLVDGSEPVEGAAAIEGDLR